MAILFINGVQSVLFRYIKTIGFIGSEIKCDKGGGWYNSFYTMASSEYFRKPLSQTDIELEFSIDS